jgi:hypothetical protein
MSIFHSSLREVKESHGTNFEGADAFKNEFPNLWAVLTGIDGDGASLATGAPAAASPPSTVMVFVEGGRLKWCASPKSGPRVAFGTIPEPMQGFWSIEAELKAGHFEWKVRRS